MPHSDGGDHRAPLPRTFHQPQNLIIRHQQQHQPYYPRSEFRSSSTASLKGCCCCCCVFLLFSLLALVALAVVLVVVLAVKPKKPQFDLQQVGVQYMGISTAEAALISLTIKMLFTVVNPNKVGIKYGESMFRVKYRGIPLGKATVPGFHQEAHSQRQVVATVAVDPFSLMQADAGDLVRNASLNDRVDLNVRGDVAARIRVMDFDSPNVQVSVNCAIVISPRNQSVTYKQCGFDGLSL